MASAIVNTVLQLGKMGVEIPLLVGGLEGKLLGYRARQASLSEEEEWRAVWEKVTAE
jgi:hypothetical protein